MPQNKYPNDLLFYRKRIRLSQEEVANLLGHKTTKHISRLEVGYCLPSITNSLKLAAIYRVPVEFLFPKLFNRLRDEIRVKEINRNNPS